MMVAIGNLLVSIIAEINWPKSQMWSYFFYAMLMAAFDFLFWIINHNYQYRNNMNASTSEVVDADPSYGTVVGDELEPDTAHKGI